MYKDEIRIQNLEIYAYHGVFAEENEKGQPFFVNAVLYTDTRKAGLQDTLEDSTHYGEVCNTLTDFIQNNVFQLIETVAEGAAREILMTYPLIEEVDLEIRKPEAPIGLPFESVSVKIHRGWHNVFIALGSNIGERENYLLTAIEKIAAHSECKVQAQSSILRTAPYGVEEQAEFLNAVIEVKTLLQPEELLNLLQQIELEANRERILRWGPRTLDLDIIFYDEAIYQTKRLTIPHIDMQNRDFVLQPIAEIAPWHRHPILQKTITEMLRDIKDAKQYVIGENEII